MRFIVDANILIHAVNSDSPRHRAARAFFDHHWQAQTDWGISWPILYEFLRVATHRSVFPQPLTPAQGLEFVEAICSNKSVTIMVNGPRHLESLNTVAANFGKPAGSVYHDLHIAALMHEYGVNEIVTADDGFLRFRHLTVTNPL